MPKESLPKRIARITASAAIAVSLASCNGQSPDNTHPSPSFSERANQDVAQDYPELAQYPLNSSGFFEVNGKTTIRWYNYTSAFFDPEAAKQTFAYFQNALPSEGIATLAQNQGKAERVDIMQRPTIKQKSLFIVPDNAPFPHWMQSQPHLANSATLLEGEVVMAGGEARTTYVRYTGSDSPDPRFSSAERNANLLFIVEACQQATRVIPASQDADFARLMQEQWCNSQGIAYIAKQMNMSYDEYKDLASKSSLPYSKLKVFIFPQSMYEDIPITGNAITETKN